MTKRTSPFRVKPIKTVALVALLAAGAVTQGVLAAEYPVTDLGALGGSNSFASDLNEPGQVVGVSRTTNGTLHAFLFAAVLQAGAASYPPGSASNSAGGAITATRTAEGHYAMHFVGLQKLPGRTEHT